MNGGKQGARSVCILLHPSTSRPSSRPKPLGHGSSATSLTWKKKLTTTMAAERSQRCHIPLCLAYLTARTSQRSMTGGVARSSSAFCMSAAAIGPLRCAVLSPSF